MTFVLLHGKAILEQLFKTQDYKDEILHANKFLKYNFRLSCWVILFQR